MTTDKFTLTYNLSGPFFVGDSATSASVDQLRLEQLSSEDELREYYQ